MFSGDMLSVALVCAFAAANNPSITTGDWVQLQSVVSSGYLEVHGFGSVVSGDLPGLYCEDNPYCVSATNDQHAQLSTLWKIEGADDGMPDGLDVTYGSEPYYLKSACYGSIYLDVKGNSCSERGTDGFCVSGAESKSGTWSFQNSSTSDQYVKSGDTLWVKSNFSAAKTQWLEATAAGDCDGNDHCVATHGASIGTLEFENYVGQWTIHKVSTTGFTDGCPTMPHSRVLDGECEGSGSWDREMFVVNVQPTDWSGKSFAEVADLCSEVCLRKKNRSDTVQYHPATWDDLEGYYGSDSTVDGVARGFVVRNDKEQCKCESDISAICKHGGVYNSSSDALPSVALGWTRYDWDIPIKYGASVRLLSGGSYVEVHGRGCEGNPFCVSGRGDFTLVKSAVWRIEGGQNGETVQYGDALHLKNGCGSIYLDVNDNSCPELTGTSGYCVSGANSKTRDGQTGTWSFTNGTGDVLDGDTFWIKSGFGDVYLDVVEDGCDGNVCVAASGADYSSWTIQKVQGMKPPLFRLDCTQNC